MLGVGGALGITTGASPELLGERALSEMVGTLVATTLGGSCVKTCGGTLGVPTPLAPTTGPSMRDSHS